MRKWTILILVAQHKNISEEKVWKYIEELGYNKHHLSSKVVFHFLVDAPSGCYTMSWSGSEVLKKKIALEGSRVLCSTENISRWIQTVLQTEKRSKRYAFIYSGGGFGFYTENDDGCPMSILDWSSCLSQIHHIKKKWDLVGFDCCLFSMLESVYQIRHLTRWILACETYEPNEGFNSREMVRAFEKSSNVKTIGQVIISSFIKRVNKDDAADPSDMVLIKTSRALDRLVDCLSAVPFHQVIKELKKNSSTKKSRIDKLDKNENGYFDLWSVIKNSKLVKVEKKLIIKQLLEKIIINYQSSEKLKRSGRSHHGLSFCGLFNLDPFIFPNYFALDAPQKLFCK